MQGPDPVDEPAEPKRYCAICEEHFADLDDLGEHSIIVHEALSKGGGSA
jgi:hypothetical protein